MPWAAVLLISLLFGAGDQYLGTTHVLVHTGEWASTVSNMSAPWLVLPFVAGLTQRSGRRAAVVGLAATLAALTGYFAMTLSPVEGVAFDQALAEVGPLLKVQVPWVLGGLATGPIFGILGCRWRNDRASISAFAVTGALALEPAVWAAVGRRSGPPTAWAAEIVVGLSVAAILVTQRRTMAAR